MNYRSRTKTIVNRRIAIVLIVLAIVSFVFVVRIGNDSIVLRLAGTVKSLQGQISDSVVSTESLMQENAQLRGKLEQLSAAEQLVLANQEAYVALWKETRSGLDEVVTAEVLLRPPYSAYDYYIINAGIQDNLDFRQFVVAGGAYNIGYVDGISSNYSRVRLYSASRDEFLVSIGGVLYPAVGRGGGVVHVRLPRNFSEEGRQVVRVPGAGSYILGFLEETSFEPQDSYILGIITLPINIFEQELVTVLQDTYEPSLLIEENLIINEE